MSDILNYLDQETSYVGKVNQNNISVPISYAAVGNENYTDIYNSTNNHGYTISDTQMPNVFSEKSKDTIGRYGIGNIDLYKRPIVKNKDGSISTIRSMSFSEDGKEVLIPTVSDEGTILSDEDAIQRYKQTGKYLGKFNSIQDANNYAERLHKEQQSIYSNKGNITGFAADINYTQQGLENISDNIADKYGVPKNLARALIKQESGWNPKAKSKVGAMGLMQLMPATAKGLGVTDAWDPIQNIEGGMKYLSSQFKKFGSWDLALAAYNAGPGNVMKHKGVPPFRETQNYVKNIMAMSGMNSKAFPVDFDFSQMNNQRKFINQDTGLVSTANLDKFLNMINTANGYKDNVMQILTNRPELLENKPEYADFEKYRKMKTTDGKPLFAKGDLDGFRIMIKNTLSKGLNRNAIPAIAEDMAKTQTDIIRGHGKDLSEALLETFANRYDISWNRQKSERFGLANLTTEEYEEYGIPVTMQQNPVMQARVLQQEFQRAFDILGSEGKAIYALAGGTLKDDEGNVQTWQEIKEDRENFMKKYFIQPSNNTKTRTAVNKQVQTFTDLCRRFRGIA